MAPLTSTLCIFCKPPAHSKSRLVPSVGTSNAARLAEAMLRDTIASAEHVDGAQIVLAMSEDFELAGTSSLPHWIQPSGDLGRRLEEILQRAARTSECVVAIGADTPGLRPEVLEEAIQSLADRDAVIGPARDGGFYLLGLRSCPDNLFRHIHWSSSMTFQETVARLKLFGLTYSLLDEWMDVDTHEDLELVRRMVAAGQLVAPHLTAALQDLDEARLRS